MAVKAMFAPLRDAWTGWWRCHKSWRRLRRQLDRAGVSNYDPLYPLIVEIGLAPARFARILALAVIVSAVVAATIWWGDVTLGRSRDGVTVIQGEDGTKTIVIEAPDGGQWRPCGSGRHVCFELTKKR